MRAAGPPEGAPSGLCHDPIPGRNGRATAVILSIAIAALVAALVAWVGYVGISLLRLPRGGDSEFLRVIGAGLVFAAVMAAVGLVMFHDQEMGTLSKISQSWAGEHRP